MRRNAAFGIEGMAFGFAGALALVAFGFALYVAAKNASTYAPVVARSTPEPTSTPRGADERITVQSVTFDSGSGSPDGGALTIALEAKQRPGDLLFEPPVLRVGGKDYPPTADSMEAARFALLDAITDGRASAEFVFAEAPESGRGLLVFNPSSRESSIVDPKIEVEVSW